MSSPHLSLCVHAHLVSHGLWKPPEPLLRLPRRSFAQPSEAKGLGLLGGVVGLDCEREESEKLGALQAYQFATSGPLILSRSLMHLLAHILVKNLLLWKPEKRRRFLVGELLEGPLHSMAPAGTVLGVCRLG